MQRSKRDFLPFERLKDGLSRSSATLTSDTTTMTTQQLTGTTSLLNGKISEEEHDGVLSLVLIFRMQYCYASTIAPSTESHHHAYDDFQRK